jgi:hypothetical protein
VFTGIYLNTAIKCWYNYRCLCVVVIGFLPSIIFKIVWVPVFYPLCNSSYPVGEVCWGGHSVCFIAQIINIFRWNVVWKSIKIIGRILILVRIGLQCLACGSDGASIYQKPFVQPNCLKEYSLSRRRLSPFVWNLFVVGVLLRGQLGSAVVSFHHSVVVCLANGP